MIELSITYFRLILLQLLLYYSSINWFEECLNLFTVFSYGNQKRKCK